MDNRNERARKNNKSELKKSSLEEYGDMAWEGFVPPVAVENRKNDLPPNPKEDTYKSHPNGLYSYEIEATKEPKKLPKEDIQKDKVVLSFSSSETASPLTSSTSSSMFSPATENIGKGSRPTINLKNLKKVPIYTSTEKFKVDEEGNAYLGKSLSEVFANKAPSNTSEQKEIFLLDENDDQTSGKIKFDDENKKSDSNFVHSGPPIRKGRLSRPKPIGEVNREGLKTDKKRGMFYSGVSLDELPPAPPPIPDDEIKDKDGKVIGVGFNLGKKR